MTAFGAHLPRHEPVFVNSLVIAGANSIFSVISGFAVFAALGHLAFIEGKYRIVTVDRLQIVLQRFITILLPLFALYRQRSGNPRLRRLLARVWYLACSPWHAARRYSLGTTSFL